jgi:hypothetical protein
VVSAAGSKETMTKDSDSDALVFFGATGDLAYKKIFPALQAMVQHGRLDVPVIGVASSPWSLEQLRKRARESVEKHGGFDGPALEKFSKFTGRVSDSGEGRWTIKAAIDEGVPVPVLSSALYERFTSRGEGDFEDKLLSAMRYQFGGHIEKLSSKQAS